jgi:hypothetical protein
MASNGISDLGRFDFVSDGMYPGSQIDHSYYANATQMPLGAQAVQADYDPETNPLTGEPVSHFANGGIASIPRYDGEDGSQVEAPAAWDPASGQVKLQQFDPKDPFSEGKSVDYTIPKDQIKNFAPDVDQETGKPTGAGQYVLNDGSTMRVGADGIVQSATPGRDEYTLNKQGYYQPTGSNLTWDGGTSMLTKKIGGVDVQVPGMFTKGAYQNPNGQMRVDDNGVPIPVAPNYLDSGFGKSGLADAAPYIAAAAMTAATMGAAAPAAGGFAGMVPASETLLGSMGYLAPAATTVAPAATTGDVFAGWSADEAAKQAALNAASGATPAATTAATTASTTGGAFEGANPSVFDVEDAAAKAAYPSGSVPSGSGLMGNTYYPSTEAAKLAQLKTAMGIAALSKLSSATGSGGATAGGGNYVATSQAPQTTTPQHTNAMPTTLAANYGQPMSSYYTQPIQTFKYYNQGGIASLAAGGEASLGSYSDGGQLLKGPGDGMSDDIPASIGEAQPARLADGEFVIPADVVSHLGNGSTDAGAKHLYKMMDRIRQARTGNHKQGKRINPEKFLPQG